MFQNVCYQHTLKLWCGLMLLIKTAPIVPELSVSSMTAFENCKNLTILRNERLSVSVNVPHLDLSQKLMCDASLLGLHGRWEQREHLHSSRSGSHHWEDEKVPTELPESPGTKSHHELTPPVTSDGKRRGLGVCCVPQHPIPLGSLSLQPAKWWEFWFYYLIHLC